MVESTSVAGRAASTPAGGDTATTSSAGPPSPIGSAGLTPNRTLERMRETWWLPRTDHGADRNRPHCLANDAPEHVAQVRLVSRLLK